MKNRKARQLFVVLGAFLVSFACAHLYSLHAGYSVFIEGYHIHHFYFGTVMLALGGILGILYSKAEVLYVASGLVGAGIGLFADEMGLLLNCTSAGHDCTYLFPDNFDIIGTIVVVILVLIFLITLAESYQIHRQNRSNGR